MPDAAIFATGVVACVVFVFAWWGAMLWAALYGPEWLLLATTIPLLVVILLGMWLSLYSHARSAVDDA